jgi:spermidine synthase
VVAFAAVSRAHNASQGDVDSRPVVVERCDTSLGEIVLRRAGDDYEIIFGGTFLMDTRDGRSERAMVAAAVEGRRDVRMLIGGLGVGFSLDEALANPEVRDVVVVEVEPTVVGWHRRYFRGINRFGLDDHRVRLVVGDAFEYVRRSGERFDAICIDVDNGPEWLVSPENARIYADAGLRELASHLAPEGRLAVWSASENEGFSARLRAMSADLEILRFGKDRGPDDIVYLARA